MKLWVCREQYGWRDRCGSEQYKWNERCAESSMDGGRDLEVSSIDAVTSVDRAV